jgi:hypothetical protein
LEIGAALRGILENMARGFAGGAAFLMLVGCSDGGGPAPVSSPPTPSLVLQLDSFLSDLRADEGHLYFEAQSSIQTLTIMGAAAPSELVHTTGEDVAVDADSVWLARGNSGAGQIIRVAKSNGAQQVVVDRQLSPGFLALDATHVFWTNRSTYQASPPDGNVVSAKKDGTELTVLVAGVEEPRNVAVDADYVYFTVGIEGATVSRVNRDGTGMVALATARHWPKDLIVAPDALYWFEDWAGSTVNSDTSPIVKLDKSASEPVVLYQDATRPHALALDGGHLYWTGQNSGDCNTNPAYVDGVVRRMPVAGGQPETLAQKLRNANDLVVTASAVYWAQSLAACGAIYSLPKP